MFPTLLPVHSTRTPGEAKGGEFLFGCSLQVHGRCEASMPVTFLLLCLFVIAQDKVVWDRIDVPSEKTVSENLPSHGDRFSIFQAEFLSEATIKVPELTRTS